MISYDFVWLCKEFLRFLSIYHEFVTLAMSSYDLILIQMISYDLCFLIFQKISVDDKWCRVLLWISQHVWWFHMVSYWFKLSYDFVSVRMFVCMIVFCGCRRISCEWTRFHMMFGDVTWFRNIFTRCNRILMVSHEFIWCLSGCHRISIDFVWFHICLNMVA